MSQPTSAAPSLELYVIRHNDKPTDTTDPHLSPLGQQRSVQFASWFVAQYGTPEFIFAAANSHESHRPVQTVTPLSKSTGIVIDSTIANKDFADLVNEIFTNKTYQHSRIVICWHHGEIPQLLAALNAPAGSYPDPWDPNAFNLLVHLTYASPNATPSVQVVTEPF